MRSVALLILLAAACNTGCYHALYGLLGGAYGDPSAGDAERLSEYESKIEAHELYERYGTKPTAAVP